MVLSVSLAEKITKHCVISFFDCPTFKPNFDSLWRNLLFESFQFECHRWNSNLTVHQQPRSVLENAFVAGMPLSPL